MISNTYHFMRGQQDFSNIPAEAEKVAEYNQLLPKEARRLRLLAEEMICLMPNLVKYGNGRFWIENSGRIYELHIVVKAHNMFDIDTEKVLSVSSDGRNASAKGIISKIGFAIEEMMRSSAAVNESMPYDFYNMGRMSYGDALGWSLITYRNYFNDGREKSSDDLAEEWDELEKSIIANLADDVKVGISGSNIEITVLVKL